MSEQDKQKVDQNDKQAPHQQHEQQKKQPALKDQQPQAGATTDPDAASDKEYAKRIEEKTEKH